MNVDVAYEILRYVGPVDRCRFRRICRAFNQASLEWWRSTAGRLDVGELVVGNKLMPFLRFISDHFACVVKRLLDFTVDESLMGEIVDWTRSPVGHKMLTLFNTVDRLDLQCLQLDNYRTLAEFLRLFRSVSQVTLTTCCSAPAKDWNGDETQLGSTLAGLTELTRLHLSRMKMKGHILTGLSPRIMELSLEECPDVDETNLLAMVARCVNLEHIRLDNVYLNLATFHRLCNSPRLCTMQLTVNCGVVMDQEWVQCVCSSDTLEEAVMIGRLQGDFGQLMDTCPWPIWITSDDGYIADQECSGYCLILHNPRYIPSHAPV